MNKLFFGLTALIIVSLTSCGTYYGRSITHDEFKSLLQKQRTTFYDLEKIPPEGGYLFEEVIQSETDETLNYKHKLHTAYSNTTSKLMYTYEQHDRYGKNNDTITKTWRYVNDDNKFVTAVSHENSDMIIKRYWEIGNYDENYVREAFKIELTRFYNTLIEHVDNTNSTKSHAKAEHYVNGLSAYSFLEYTNSSKYSVEAEITSSSPSKIEIKSTDNDGATSTEKHEYYYQNVAINLPDLSTYAMDLGGYVPE